MQRGGKSTNFETDIEFANLGVLEDHVADLRKLVDSGTVQKKGKKKHTNFW